jgi:hypothetical protein
MRGTSTINPNYLSLESEAHALLLEIGGDGITEDGGGAVFPYIYPPEEPRRAWNILFHGRPVNAGLLLLNRHAKGVGAPGHWDLSKEEPLWISDPSAPTGVDDPRPPRDVPVRDLLPNEKFQAGLMGVGVVRTDLKQTTAEASGQFTAEDRTTLRLIYQVVSKGAL